MQEGFVSLFLEEEKMGQKKHAHSTRILKQKRLLQEFKKQNYYVMGKFKDYYIQELDCNCLSNTECSS